MRDGFESFGYRAGSVRTVFIKTSDGLSLGAWHLLPHSSTQRPVPGLTLQESLNHRGDVLLKSAKKVYLYFHGNAGNRATFHRNDFYKMMTALGEESHVLTIDYRGFGDSSSAVPTEKGLALDSMAAYEWLVARGVPPARIILVGHSLGTGVATNLAFLLTQKTKPLSQQLFGGLILLSGYASICDAALGYPMVPLLLPFQGYTMTERWIKSRFVDHWSSAQKISTIRAPILIVHGKKDIEIQLWQGRALFLEAAGGRLGRKFINDDCYWDLRQSTSKFVPRELDGIMVTDLGENEGDLWCVDMPKLPSGSSARASTTTQNPHQEPVWLLEITHGAHNNLSKFLILADTIESWTTACAAAGPKLY
ncbi:hypothetical protein BSLG_007902 [Batrachochytrium salamandrivorans]|nr:hypothetical protein BSLG_007902 [Batrachochytrium salamandrivorans]